MPRLDVIGVIVADLRRSIAFYRHLGLEFAQDAGDDGHGHAEASVDRTYRDLIGAGGTEHRAPWDAFWGQRYAQLKDPDGNVIETAGG